MLCKLLLRTLHACIYGWIVTIHKLFLGIRVLYLYINIFVIMEMHNHFCIFALYNKNLL